MIDLSSLFSEELSKKMQFSVENKSLKSINLRTRETSESSKTALQLVPIPLQIDIDTYKNAHSPDNPVGDYKAAYRFSVLANTIPLLGRYYNTSPYLVSNTYGAIVDAAISDVPYTQRLLKGAQEAFSLSAISGMGGIPDDDWYPVYANPYNWYDMIQDNSNMIELEISLNNNETDNSDLIVLDGSVPMTWNVTNQNNVTRQLNMSKSTAIRKINLHILRVDLIRPWLNFEVFNLQNWKIQGIKAGYYSSGSTDKNNGMFPLLTQTVLIGTKISVEGNFSQKDIRIVTEHKEAGNDISFGSFLLNTISNVIEVFQTEGGTKLNSNIHQVVGYISKVVPMSPSL